MAEEKITKPKIKRPSKVQLDPRKCFTCGTLFTPNRFWHGYCSVQCREKAKEKTKREREPKAVKKSTVSSPFGNIKCPVCEDDFVSTRPSQKYCSHRCFRLRLQRNWINKNREKGLCYSCPEVPLNGTNSYCEKHWLGQAAWRAGLRGPGSGEKLKIILEKQNYTCPYTGRKLILGVNASVDHKIPRSLSRENVGSIDNLEWVETEVNRAKRTLTKEEFISLCKLIASRFP